MEQIEDRRDYDRIETEHSVKIVEREGTEFPAIAADISLTGMQLLCDRPTAYRIAPKGHESTPDEEVEVHVRASLPMRDGSRAKVGVYCELVKIRRVSEDEYRLGLRYRRFENRSYDEIERWVDDWL
ncbi:MAG: PilZ domain-containing protein [Gammaproteobacteria bacterium]|jgi:c-di-GMP-binding flagellar brake protein YcgR